MRYNCEGKAREGKGLTERFFLDDHGIVWRVIDDGRLDEVAITLLDLWLPGREGVSVLLAVAEEVLNFFVLHVVLDGAEHDACLVAAADFEGLGEVHHGFDEGLVDAFVDVDALCGDADLARVEEGAHGDFGGGLGDVDVGEDNGGVVPAAGGHWSVDTYMTNMGCVLTVLGLHASRSWSKLPLSSCRWQWSR